MKRSGHMGFLLSVIAAAVALVWALQVWHRAQSVARAAARDLEISQALELEISALRDQPRQARSASLEQPEMARRIEQAAQQAGIDKRNIERIAPGEPHRVKDSVFMETPTQIKLDQVTLAQLIPFLHGLSVSDDGGRDLRVDSLRMGAPRRAESGNTWSVEITVCYLVYAPKTEPSIH